MTSINTHYTFQYSQPEDYKFSHDSVFMARRVFEDISAHPLPIQNALDLCSGCGIIGLDLLFHSQDSSLRIENFDFIEVQQEYASYFQDNAKTLKSIIPSFKTNLKFLNLNYEAALKLDSLKEKYDLIVCNPPYFLTTQGKLSDNQFKNRCRFFIDSNLISLIQFIEHSLSKEGRAYLIFHDLKDHKINLLEEIKKMTGSAFFIEILPDVRKSEFICLSRARP